MLSIFIQHWLKTLGTVWSTAVSDNNTDNMIHLNIQCYNSYWGWHGTIFGAKQITHWELNFWVSQSHLT